MKNKIRYLSEYIQNNKVYYNSYKYKRGEKSPLHSHDFYEIYFVKNGMIKHLINGNEFLLVEGSVQFINPLDVHSLEGGSNEESEILNFAFSKALLETLINHTNISELGYNPAVKADLGLYKILVKYYHDMLDNILTVNEYTSFLLLNYLFLSREKDRKQVSLNDIIPYWLKKTLNRMESHENLVLGIDRFIDLSGKSQEHASRVMKKHFDMTITEWINEQKLERARSLILNTDSSIIDIIYEVGYESESYFFRLYKKRFNITPYKDRLRKSL